MTHDTHDTQCHNRVCPWCDKEGLVSNTFRNNPYMRLHVDKWKENGAKERVLRLVEAYENAIQKRLSE